MEKSVHYARTAFLSLLLFTTAALVEVHAQSPSHPHLFFDRAGMEALQFRVLNNPRLNTIWWRYKVDRVDRSYQLVIPSGGRITDLDTGRYYGDGLADMAIAYIVLRDSIYVDKALYLMTQLASKNDWGEDLIIAHISMGFALAWDVMYDQFSSSDKNMIRDAITTLSDNQPNNDPYTNHNWTPSAGEGLVGLAFQGDGNANFNSFVAAQLQGAKDNYKENNRNVLWAHGTDGFPHQGLGYWRKYTHVGLFLNALRYNQPQNDWFHLGKPYPGCEFLEKAAYPRIYADVQHPDLAALTWADSRQVVGEYGNISTLTLIASEYKEGYAMDFIDYLLYDAGYRMDGEDWATFLFYDDRDVPAQSFRSLPLSRYWPDMEAAIFRGSWSTSDLVFYMRCGSPGGHGRQLKSLPTGGHDHPDANGFVLFYNNDYLAAEDGASPLLGPKVGTKDWTDGHNTFLIDGAGQKGDGTSDITTTSASMDYMDCDHVGYLLGDATDAYSGLNRFYRYVIYKRNKYAIIVDELRDNSSHKYEFLLGTDSHHTITASGSNTFTILPQGGTTRLPLVFVEPQQLSSSIARDRAYAMDSSMVDMLRVWPATNSTKANFLTLLYPRKDTDPDPVYSKLYTSSLSGIVVDGDETYLYNEPGTAYTQGNVSTNATLCYFKDNSAEFEYLVAGCTDFLYNGDQGITSDKLLVAGFKGVSGKIRLGKNLGSSGTANITLRYPGITGVEIDGQIKTLTGSGTGWLSFQLSPKEYKIGPTGYEQTVTDNYAAVILAVPALHITSPNGGESWTAGTTQTITWSFQGSIGNVTLELSPDNGGSWATIVSSTTNDGSYNWIIPDAASNQSLVRVSDAADGDPADVSDAVFAIVPPPPPPAISSFYPNSGFVTSEVTILGTNFTGASSVQFNGTPAASFAVDSDIQIHATVPLGATTGTISVTTAGGTALSAADFTVTPSSLTTVSFLPLHDAYVRSSNANTNYGSAATLRVRKSSAETMNSYLKFAVSALSGPVQNAKLRLYVTDASSDGGSVYAVSNNYEGSATAWAERGLKWSNAPAITGNALSAAGAAVVGNWIELDVTSAITGNGTYSFALKNNVSNVVYYTSKEGTKKPELVMQVRSWPPSTTPSISSFTPSSGPVGTEVTITGAQFTGATSVTFNGASAAFTFASDTQLRATVPADAPHGGGKISVTTAGGTTLSANDFTVTTGGGGETTQSFQPLHDAYVKSSSATSNYGAAATLRLRKSSGETLMSYLKFEVSGLSGTVASATLQLYVSDASSDGGAVYLVSNNYQGATTAWTQGGLNWNNAPVISGTALSSAGAASVGNWIEFDVTSAITGNGVYSFALKNNVSDVVYYGSREASNKPLLVVRGYFNSLTISAYVEDEPLATSPTSFELHQNYPNPFNPETEIRFQLPEASHVTVKILNILGEELRTLADEQHEAGLHRVRWNGLDYFGNPVASGIYLYQIRAGNFLQVKKMSLLR